MISAVINDWQLSGVFTGGSGAPYTVGYSYQGGIGNANLTGNDNAIDALKIPRDHAGMLVAGDTYVEAETPLTDGQQLNIFPPLAGGAC